MWKICRKGTTKLYNCKAKNGNVQFKRGLLQTGVFTAVLKGMRWECGFSPYEERELDELNRFRPLVDACTYLSRLLGKKNISWEAEYSIRHMREIIKGINNEPIIEEEHEILLLSFSKRDSLTPGVTYQVTGIPGDPIDENKILQLADRIDAALSVRGLETGSYHGRTPVILADEVAALLVHEVLGHMLEEPLLVQNDKLRSQSRFPLMQRNVNVMDVIATEDSYVNISYDQEGSYASDALLIECGEMKSTIRTRMSSKEPFSKNFMGHARAASIGTPPLPRVRNLVLGNGLVTFKESLSSCVNGILAFKAFPWAGIFPERDFYWIEIETGRVIIDGEIGPYLSGFALTGSIRQLLETMIPLNDKPYQLKGFCCKHGQYLPVSTTAPSIFVPDMELIGLNQ